METKKCMSCKEPIHPKRLEILPNTTKCVSCSTTGKKGGITVTKGEGDHTYNETIIMEPEEFRKFQEIEARLAGKPFDDTAPLEADEVSDDEDDEYLDDIGTAEDFDFTPSED
jgi:hypothetical protein